MDKNKALAAAKQILAFGSKRRRMVIDREASEPLADEWLLQLPLKGSWYGFDDVLPPDFFTGAIVVLRHSAQVFTSADIVEMMQEAVFNSLDEHLRQKPFSVSIDDSEEELAATLHTIHPKSNRISPLAIAACPVSLRAKQDGYEGYEAICDESARLGDFLTNKEIEMVATAANDAVAENGINFGEFGFTM